MNTTHSTTRVTSALREVDDQDEQDLEPEVRLDKVKGAHFRLEYRELATRVAEDVEPFEDRRPGSRRLPDEQGRWHGGVRAEWHEHERPHEARAGRGEEEKPTVAIFRSEEDDGEWTGCIRVIPRTARESVRQFMHRADRAEQEALP